MVYVYVQAEVDTQDVLSEMDVKDIQKYLRNRNSIEINYNQGVIFSELLDDVEMELRRIDKTSLATRVNDLSKFLKENGE